MSVTSPRNTKSLTPLVAVSVCFVAAGLTLLWADSPTYDPWSWLVWARQLSGESVVAFSSAGASGWKPLPVVVALPFNWLGGESAPIAWLWLERTALFLIPFAAWRLGRLSAGIPGAVSAAVATLLFPEVFVYFGGLTEPVVSLMLMLGVAWAVEEKVLSAWFAGLVAVLGRPEALAAVLPWGIWEAAKRKLPLLWFTLGLVLTTLLWIGGDWIGTGKPLGLLGKADKSDEPLKIQAADQPGLEILSRLHVQPVVLVLAIAAFIAAWVWSDKVSKLLGLTILAVGGSIVLATQFIAYPGVPRYVVPVLPPLFALAGIGVGRLGNIPKQGWAKAALTTALLAALVALAGPMALRLDRTSIDWYEGRNQDDSTLKAAINSAGGRKRVLECGKFTTDPTAEVSSAAWILDLQLEDVMRGGIDSVHSWNAPMLIAVSDQRLPLFKEKAAERELKPIRISQSPNWSVWSIGTRRNPPCTHP